LGEDARTPQQVAEDLELPLEAVLESIDYCVHNQELLRQEREEELARIRLERCLGSAPPAHAIGQGIVVLTSDRADFRDLHELVLISGGGHPGMLVVAYENNPKRDMKPKHITAAVQKLERAGLDITNQVVVLNQWR
jgi:hypothetical protein